MRLLFKGANAPRPMRLLLQEAEDTGTAAASAAAAAALVLRGMPGWGSKAHA